MPKVIKGSEKILVYCFFACCDLVQIILDVFIVSEVINHVLDFIIGGILLLYGQKKGLWTGQKLLVLLAVFAGEQIPFVNALPFWTLDVKNLFSGTVSEAPPEENGGQTYLNRGDTRLPSGKPEPFYANGVGRVRE